MLFLPPVSYQFATEKKLDVSVRLYELHYLPQGLFAQLLVRALPLMYPLHYWRGGVVMHESASNTLAALFKEGLSSIVVATVGTNAGMCKFIKMRTHAHTHAFAHEGFKEGISAGNLKHAYTYTRTLMCIHAHMHTHALAHALALESASNALAAIKMPINRET